MKKESKNEIINLLKVMHFHEVWMHRMDLMSMSLPGFKGKRKRGTNFNFILTLKYTSNYFIFTFRDIVFCVWNQILAYFKCKEVHVSGTNRTGKRKQHSFLDIPEEATSEDHTTLLTTIYTFLVQEAAGTIIDSATQQKS